MFQESTQDMLITMKPINNHCGKEDSKQTRTGTELRILYVNL